MAERERTYGVANGVRTEVLQDPKRFFTLVWDTKIEILNVTFERDRKAILVEYAAAKRGSDGEPSEREDSVSSERFHESLPPLRMTVMAFLTGVVRGVSWADSERDALEALRTQTKKIEEKLVASLVSARYLPLEVRMARKVAREYLLRTLCEGEWLRQMASGYYEPSWSAYFRAVHDGRLSNVASPVIRRDRSFVNEVFLCQEVKRSGEAVRCGAEVDYANHAVGCGFYYPGEQAVLIRKAIPEGTIVNEFPKREHGLITKPSVSRSEKSRGRVYFKCCVLPPNLPCDSFLWVDERPWGLSSVWRPSQEEGRRQKEGKKREEELKMRKEKLEPRHLGNDT
ncbi:predicted protein [Nematostella vectensis]|uniref:Uncharacterized protein n=1 Tax=Nematostella vectensis TaxID=45351 RepID=A7S964_NEMVE|nr:predicted protein [Nematostella vectensis]|eukprot:XP_001631863.1 predicted protein [Nematostella vectensis]